MIEVVLVVFCFGVQINEEENGDKKQVSDT